MLRGAPERALEGLWGDPDAFGEALGSSGGTLGGLWGSSGRLGRALRMLWVALKVSRGPLGEVLGSLGRVLEGLGVVLGLSWGCLGGVLGGFLGVWEGSKGSQKSLGKAKMHFQDLTENIEKTQVFL